MKKYIKKHIVILLIVLIAAVPVFAATYASFLRDTGIDDKTIGLNTQGQIEIKNPARPITSGWTYYVDSATGDAASDGLSWVTAMATVDGAINRAAARVSNGTDTGKPVIYVREGHNEALTTADGVDADLAGVTIIGLGRGTHMPTFDYDIAAAMGEFVIGAANVRLENLRFRCSSASTTSAIDIEAAGDNFEIVNCQFGFAETAGTDDWINTIVVNTTVDNGFIGGCLFRLGAAAASSAIHIVSSTAGITITGNHFQGDYSAACIYGSGGVGNLCQGVVITNNTLINGTIQGDGEINTEPAISLGNNTGGFIANNDIVSDVATALLMIVADDCVRFANKVSDTDGAAFSGSWEAGQGPSKVTSVSAHVDG